MLRQCLFADAQAQAAAEVGVVRVEAIQSRRQEAEVVAAEARVALVLN